ncbi:MAG: hypothetical protein JWN80_641 [Microbacteriaceae bacterium]|jgi:hypothetical protein|nr:hypothetical protein [Microbacteriaceae bacterium]
MTNYTHDEQIEVVKLNETDWVIYDRLQESVTGCGVVGFVNHVAGVYELLKLSAPAEPEFYSTLRDAVDVFQPMPALAS